MFAQSIRQLPPTEERMVLHFRAPCQASMPIPPG